MIPTTLAAEFARALSGSEVSVTAILGPKSAPGPPKQQPPIVSMFPVPLSKPPVLHPEVAHIKKPLELPQSMTQKKSNGVHNLPVLHIPEYTPSTSASFGGSVHKRTKKSHVLPPVPTSVAPSSAASSGISGHPGMPNGLLQLSTSLQQKGSTKVTPKDQNARMALSKIGLVTPSPITVSMAKSAASAVTSVKNTLLKPAKSNKSSSSKAGLLKTHQSPESSRSSSRNSSVSPRERPSSGLKNRASPPSGAHLKKSLSGQTGSGKKSSSDSSRVSRPLIPWSKRNSGPPKNCNGWAWVGEGCEQKVYLNVSY
jgi:hypothetical protein